MLIRLIGKRLTEVFYDGGEIVLEFDGNYRLQVSPKGAQLQTRAGAPSILEQDKIAAS